MLYNGLVDERNEWRKQLEDGSPLDIYVLQLYRLNRESNLWRSTREVEKLCETILFLEGAKPMSETNTVVCDQCGADITNADSEHMYRIRVIEEVRAGANLPANKELPSPSLNFCNKAHLNEWLSAH